MKLTHVFGLVVAVHAAVFTVIFATPGCRSTRKAPHPGDTDPAVASSSVTPVDSVAATPVAPMNYGDVNAGAPTASHDLAEPVTPVTASYDSGAGVRFAPTRPAAPVAPAAPAAAQPVSAAATHTVAKGDNLWSIAKKYGITVAELSAANQLAPSATLRLGQTLTVPAKAAAPAPASGDAAANTYAVKSGDTLGTVARKHGTTVSALRAANNLSGDSLRVGQKLVIPGNATPLSTSTTAATVAPTAAAARAGGGTYTVAPGDTLGSIAQRHGVKSSDLGVLNNITDPKKLRVGQVLKLPAGAKTASAGAKAGATPRTAAPAAVSAPAPTVAPAATPAADPAPVAPAEPVTPVEPMAVPVIRIDG